MNDPREKYSGEGGPAFPGMQPPEHWGDPSRGMTLRDWFAGQAVAGGIARDTLPDYDLIALFGKHRTGIRREEILAADAYRVADAMLAARGQKS